MTPPLKKIPTGTAPVPRVSRRASPDRTFGREDWVNAAHKALIRGGVDQVKVDQISKQVQVTRGSFYWHFRSRTDLLDALLDHWAATNTGPLLRAIEAAIAEGPAGFHRIARIWIEEREFKPAYDTAVRDWARKDPKVAVKVHAVDARRIEALQRLMQACGHAPDEALVRARVMYFHQVGYYALGIRETASERLRLEPLYMKVLSGHEA